jgi:hypothetical protein
MKTSFTNQIDTKSAIDVDIRTHYMRFVIAFLKTGDTKLLQEFVVLRSPITVLLDDLRRDGVQRPYFTALFHFNNDDFVFLLCLVYRRGIFGRVLHRTIRRSSV